MNSAVIKAFDEYERHFPSTQGADARELKAEQRHRWAQILDHIATSSTATLKDSRLSEDIRDIAKHIAVYIEFLVRIKQDKYDDWVVSSDIPLIDNVDNIIFLHSQNRDAVIGAVAFETIQALGTISELAPQFSSFNVIGSGFYAGLQMRYASEKIALRGDIIDRTKDLTSKAEEVAAKFEKQLKLQSDLVTEGSKKHRTEMDLFSVERQDAISNLEKNLTERVDAFLAAQQELDKIRKPVELWAKAAKRHRREFWAGMLCLLLMVGGSTYGVVEYINPALNSLGFVKDNTAQPFSPASTLTLAAMIALIAGAGFILKIAGRFVTNSLTLAEDAQVRAALSDTFIGLTAEETKATDEARSQARTVMLAALFRPLPGHQQEDITAPTVLSLAQDLLKKPG